MSNGVPKFAARRDVLRLSALGGVVFASHVVRSLTGCGNGDDTAASGTGADAGATFSLTPRPGSPRGAQEDFFFLQLSDPHWGFSGPMVNPDAAFELPSAVALINASPTKPDFIVFTGDLTHNADDKNVRLQRMMEFKQIVSALEVPMVKFMPGEHDAGDDGGAAFRQVFGDTYYSFDYKGIHFVAVDNVSDPTANLGDAQLAWLEKDLEALDADAPIVVFTHKPLWSLRADWDWVTLDGQKAIDLLMPFQNVTVFFGHIHQELQYMTGHIPHYAARSMMFGLPSPDLDAQVPSPLPWDATKPNKNLGYRSIAATTTPASYTVNEIDLPVPASTGDGGVDASFIDATAEGI